MILQGDTEKRITPILKAPQEMILSYEDMIQSQESNFFGSKDMIQQELGAKLKITPSTHLPTNTAPRTNMMVKPVLQMNKNKS